LVLLELVSCPVPMPRFLCTAYYAC
jgi:hypothetical protein